MTSQTPRAETDSAASALVARLRAEQGAQEDKGLQALLLHECGALEEANGEEPVAARDYLAAFNADPQFREPLEALVRILTRRKSIKNLGKLLDALTRAADTPDEKARALWERAAFIQTHEQNVPAAKELLEQAVTITPEDPALWLELELIAGKEGDTPARLRALEARAELASDPTWKALLFADLAELAAASGDTPKAYDLLGSAAALEGRARFRTQLALEAIAAKDNNLEELARALEGQSDLIEEALEDPAGGDANGVPRFLRKAEYAADTWFRAAEIKRRLGDAQAGSTMLERAVARLPDASVLQRAKLVALESSGDAAGAAAIAKAELGRGVTGAGAASLWLRIAEAAALGNDRSAALGALRSALDADPGCVPARALLLDLVGDGQEPSALANALEQTAETLGTDEGKGRAFLLSAYVWSAQAKDVDSAKMALSQAMACGVSGVLVARVGRTLASLANDASWYEDATRRLLASTVENTEQPGLWFELGRSRLLRGDEAGASEAFAKLAALDEGSAWLGRVLGAYAIGLGTAPAEGEEAAKPRPRSPDAIEALAKTESEPLLARGLWVIAALRSLRGGDVARARVRLRELHEASPGDEVVAVFLAELDRAAGDAQAAASVLSACAAASDDPEFAAALHLEAALGLWRAGDRVTAIAALEASRGASPKAGATLLGWAVRGVDPDTIEGRRRALDVAAEAGGDPVGIAIERFGLEAMIGDPAEALAALETVERDGHEDLAVAGALARILWPAAAEQREAVERALGELDELGEAARAISRAERFRLARAVDQDRAAATAHAGSWAEADDVLPVAVEWLAAALASTDREAEVAARRAAARHFSGTARAAMEASAALAALVLDPQGIHPLVAGEGGPAELMNLELSPPGCDPRRRAAALHGLGNALGDEAALDALALAGWSYLAANDYEAARDAFQAVLETRGSDVACWEGARAASEALGNHVQSALAAAQLGSLCKNPERGALFWEKAGLTLLEHTDAKEDAEIAFERAFDRDAHRSIAFDKLFRAVRSRNEDDRLLGIIEKRLDVSEDESEIGKLYWERARVLRKKKDLDGALSALENVTMLEPDHVGALALSGEICISKQDFAGAAPYLARLSTIKEAPTQQRLMSGVAAVDLFENKLQQPEKALEVLVGLHKAGLSTPPVRERLAKVAARAGAWNEATSILETLMNERDTATGRMEAARLAMAIWRDKLNAPGRAQAAVAKLLEEAADDVEGVSFVLDQTSFDAHFRSTALGRAKVALLAALARNPVDAARVDLLARIAAAGQDAPLRQATLGALVAVGKNTREYSEELARLDARVAKRPQIVLDAAALDEIADPEDRGPVTELMPLIAETAALALGPTLSSLNITKKEKVQSSGGHPLRVVVAEWMGAVGLTGDFDLYQGGADPRGVFAIAAEQPAIVLGSQINVPFDAAARSAVAREVFALRRGITAVRTRDENTVASLVIAACIEAGLAVPEPRLAVFGEVARSVKKEMSRKVRKGIVEVCQRMLSSGQDPGAWAAAARRSIDRMSVIAAGDVSIVLSDVLGVPREQTGQQVPHNDRAKRLLGFVLSPSYLELRTKLGMGVR